MHPPMPSGLFTRASPRLSAAWKGLTHPHAPHRSWTATQPDHRSLAKILGLQFILGALVIAVTLALPAPDESDEPYLIGIGLVAFAIGVALRFSPRAGQRSVDAGIATIIILLTFAVTVARPMGLAPLFYFWPLMLSAYHATTRYLIVTTAFAIVLFGVALLAGAQTENAPVTFIEFSAVASAVVVATRRLRAMAAQLFGDLERLASHDALTGALNRGGFERAFAQAADAAGTRHASHQAALLLLDVDHFKAVNDQYGHPAGDAALRHLSDVVRSALREEDVFGRVGGEEFAVLLPAIAPADALLVADRIRHAVEAGSSAAGPPFTVSIGIANSAASRDPWGAADRALYAAKRGGRNRVVLADCVAPSPTQTTMEVS